MYLEGFLSVVTDPEMYLVILIGVAVGIVFGAIPGLTATMAITMCLPLTYAMDTKTSVCVLMALYVGGISGGLISAILLNIPGTPSSLATTFDGAPMAAKGQAMKALGVGVFYSFIGTIVGLIVLMAVAPQLSKVAIKFSPFEYCALAIFSLILVIALAGKDMIKGLISGVLGLMFATVGLSPIDSMKRFTFGNVNLTGGFQLLTLLIGLYAIKADTSKLSAIAEVANEEVEKEKKAKATSGDWVWMIGLALIVSAISQWVGAKMGAGFADIGLKMFDKGTCTPLFVTILGLVCAVTPLGNLPAANELSSVLLYAVVALLATQAPLNALIEAPMWVVYGVFILVLHVIGMYVLSKLFHWDLCMVSTASVANIGGPASAPIIAVAYNPNYAGIGVLMGIFGQAIGNFAGLGMGWLLNLMA